jgi:hypothetical protein
VFVHAGVDEALEAWLIVGAAEAHAAARHEHHRFSPAGSSLGFARAADKASSS